MVNHTTDALDSSETGETTDGGFGETLDVVVSEADPGFAPKALVSSSGHVCFLVPNECDENELGFV